MIKYICNIANGNHSEHFPMPEIFRNVYVLLSFAEISFCVYKCKYCP